MAVGLRGRILREQSGAEAGDRESNGGDIDTKSTERIGRME